MADPRTLEELNHVMTEIDEGMSTWKGLPRPNGTANAERKKAGLMGVGTSSRFTPLFRPFDLLTAPNQRLRLVENEFHRIGVESVCGVQDAFHRYVDSDLFYFQFAGTTTLETELGIVEVQPGEVVVVPAGIAHRSIGTPDSLRFYCESKDMVDHIMPEDEYTSETSFQLHRTGGPDWQPAPGADKPTYGKVTERMHIWADGPDDFTIMERDYDNLVGVATPGRSEVGVVKRHAFDHFRGIVGKKNSPPKVTQPIFETARLRIQTYNIVGAQEGFHRGLNTEEFRIQFRGRALDLSELGNVEMGPGDVSIIPRGIAHSVITDPPDDQSFLRLNFYSSEPWRVTADLTAHKHHSSFEVETTVCKEAAWRG